MTAMANLRQHQGVEKEKDSVGGSGFLVDSGIHNCMITMAHFLESKGGAMGIFLEVKTEDNASVKQTFYMTSGKAKGCTTYYEKDGRTYDLPGFSLANSLALLTTGKEIGELPTEKKTILKYNPEAKKEVPTEVTVWVDLLNKPIKAGILKKIVDKTALNQVTNQYEPTGETREINEFDKFFRAADNFTVAELKDGQEATFIETWADKFTGTVKNEAKGASATQAGVQTGMPGAAPAMGQQPAQAAPQAAAPLFG